MGPYSIFRVDNYSIKLSPNWCFIRSTNEMVFMPSSDTGIQTLGRDIHFLSILSKTQHSISSYFVILSVNTSRMAWWCRMDQCYFFLEFFNSFDKLLSFLLVSVCNMKVLTQRVIIFIYHLPIKETFYSSGLNCRVVGAL